MYDGHPKKANLAYIQPQSETLRPSTCTRFMLSSTKDIFKSKVNESLSFVNWALGQPNNFGNDQNFVSISYPNFKWGDWSGDTIGEVVCQQEIKGELAKL